MKKLFLLCALGALVYLSGCSKMDTTAAKNSTTPAKVAIWTLNLDGVETPQTPVAGQIHGQDFKAVYASIKGGALLLTVEAPGHPLEHGLQIMFYDGTELATMANKTISIKPDPNHPDPKKATTKATVVQLFWKDAAGAHRDVYFAGYSLRLEFGALANGQLPGSIYLCTPDAEKSFLAGTFTADVGAKRVEPKRTEAKHVGPNSTKVSDITILSAEFGAKGQAADVKPRIIELLTKQPKGFMVEQQSLGANLLPGVTKTLKICYVYQGKTNVFSIMGHHKMSYQSLIDQAGQ